MCMLNKIFAPNIKLKLRLWQGDIILFKMSMFSILVIFGANVIKKFMKHILKQCIKDFKLFRIF